MPILGQLQYQHPNTVQCRYRQYQHQTIPSIPIPKSVGVGTCLATAIFGYPPSTFITVNTQKQIVFLQNLCP